MLLQLFSLVQICAACSPHVFGTRVKDKSLNCPLNIYKAHENILFSTGHNTLAHLSILWMYDTVLLEPLFVQLG